jgi:D-isomer specific 2-hydroxyacid dehydrogenase, NAD binding domain
MPRTGGGSYRSDVAHHSPPPELAISRPTTAPVPTVLQPTDTAALLEARHAVHASPNVWVYRYLDPETGWRLSIATCAAPGSGRLSLGGFRIATTERTDVPGFDSDREAAGLAAGMEEKVRWSRLLGIAGPLARRDTTRIVGGKCVLHPSADARIGQPHDVALLDFAVLCLKDAESRGGFSITTGQDLGHGVMSDFATRSLHYLHERFPGCVVSDTSQPTGAGNYHVLAAMLRGIDIDVRDATVGLIGCGNVGTRVLQHLRDAGTTVLALDASETRRAELRAMGLRVFAPDEKAALLSAPIDALVVNAAGGSLDMSAIGHIVANDHLRVICGSENLAMPNERDGSDALRTARKAYAPTELGGMMGYLTAAEEYLAHVEGVAFAIEHLITASAQLEAPVLAAMRELRAQDFRVSFEDALTSQAVSA